MIHSVPLDRSEEAPKMVPAPKADGSLSVDTSKMAEYLGIPIHGKSMGNPWDFLDKFLDMIGDWMGEIPWKIIGISCKIQIC